MIRRIKLGDSIQSGNVMLSVMVVSAILMGIGATLYNHFVVSEANAVEKSLVDTRTYWAMMGNANLLLGRTLGQGLPCETSGSTTSVGNLALNADTTTNPSYACASDGTGSASTASDNKVRVGALQYYFDGPSQFNDDDAGSSRDIGSPGVRTWRYPVENFTDTDVDYQIKLQSIVRQRNDPSTSSVTYLPNDGRFRVDISVYSVGSVPVLSDLTTRSPTLTVGFCVKDQTGYNTGVTPTGHNLATPYLLADPRRCGRVLDNSTIPAISEGYNRIEFIQWNMAIP